MNVYVASLPLRPETLIVISRSLREYVGLSRDGSYVHHVRPARADEPVVVDGLREVGQLTCDCKGGRFHGTCYLVMTAQAIERADASGITRPPELGPDPRAALESGVATFDAPAEAGEMVEASRG